MNTRRLKTTVLKGSKSVLQQPTMLMRYINAKSRLKHEEAKGTHGLEDITNWVAAPAVAVYSMLKVLQVMSESESARLPPICPGLSLLLVLAIAPRIFLRVLRFSFLLKNQHF